jgi:hypothetical protein
LQSYWPLGEILGAFKWIYFIVAFYRNALAYYFSSGHQYKQIKLELDLRLYRFYEAAKAIEPLTIAAEADLVNSIERYQIHQILTMDELIRIRDRKMSEKFWMVWVAGSHNTNKRHATQSQAQVEAERLANLEGKSAYVLEAVSVSEKISVETRLLS